MKSIFCTLFLCTLLGCSQSPQQKIRKDVRKFLSSIPLKERHLLDYFFRRLIQDDTLGYVLLGSKPMTYYSYRKPKTEIQLIRSDPFFEFELFLYGLHPSESLFDKGLNLWKKYENRFCGKNIFFNLLEENQEFHYVNLLVINKKLVLPLIHQHFSRFLSVDPTIQNEETFFTNFLTNEKLKNQFYSRNDLLGICLGFGEKNADLFDRMVKVHTAMGWLDFTLYVPSSEHRAQLEKEWDNIKNASGGVGKKIYVSHNFTFNSGVGFRADKTDPETVMLKKKYQDYRKILAQTYQGADFLEKTLELIKLANSNL